MIDKDLIWLVRLFSKNQSRYELSTMLTEEINEMWDAVLVEDVVKELADVVWCAIARIEGYGYSAPDVLNKLFNNNFTKLTTDLATLSPTAVQHVVLLDKYNKLYALVDNGSNKICKPASFVKLTADDINACRHDNDPSA